MQTKDSESTAEEDTGSQKVFSFCAFSVFIGQHCDGTYVLLSKSSTVTVKT